MRKTVFILLPVLPFLFGPSLRAASAAADIRGRVLSALDGRPVAGAEASIAGSEGTRTQTDAEGAFLLKADGRPVRLFDLGDGLPGPSYGQEQLEG